MPEVKAADTVKVDLETGKIIGHVKFNVGNIAYCTSGNGCGRIGMIVSIEKHVGSSNMVKLEDAAGNTFVTLAQNVTVIGEGNAPWISLPKHQGVRLNTIEDRALRVRK